MIFSTLSEYSGASDYSRYVVLRCRVISLIEAAACPAAGAALTFLPADNPLTHVHSTLTEAAVRAAKLGQGHDASPSYRCLAKFLLMSI